MMPPVLRPVPIIYVAVAPRCLHARGSSAPPPPPPLLCPALGASKARQPGRQFSSRRPPRLLLASLAGRQAGISRSLARSPARCTWAPPTGRPASSLPPSVPSLPGKEDEAVLQGAGAHFPPGLANHLLVRAAQRAAALHFHRSGSGSGVGVGARKLGPPPPASKC